MAKKATTVRTEDWVLLAVAASAFVVAFVAMGTGAEAMEDDEPARLVLAHYLLAGASFVMSAGCAWYRSRRSGIMRRRWPVGFAVMSLFALVLGFTAPGVLGVVFQIIAAFV